MVNLGLVVFLGIVGAAAVAFGLRERLEPAAQEAGIVVSDLQALRQRLSEADADEKDTEKGERE